MQELPADVGTDNPHGWKFKVIKRRPLMWRDRHSAWMVIFDEKGYRPEVPQ